MAPPTLSLFDTVLLLILAVLDGHAPAVVAQPPPKLGPSLLEALR